MLYSIVLVAAKQQHESPIGVPMSRTFTASVSTSVGFSDSSVGKKATCNIGDPSLIPESGRSTGEGKGYPLQYSWTSLVAQLVKNLPAIQETWVQSLSCKDPLEKGKATYSSILAWRILYSPRGCKELDTTEQLSLFHICSSEIFYHACFT